MKKFFKILIWILVGALFIGTFVYLYFNSKPKQTQYELVTPDSGDIERTTVLTGKIEPRDEIEIKPQVSGIIAEINVEAGDMVKEGDVVSQGQVIGVTGSTGISSGPHLHYEIKEGGSRIDPRTYLPGWIQAY